MKVRVRFHILLLAPNNLVFSIFCCCLFVCLDQQRLNGNVSTVNYIKSYEVERTGRITIKTFIYPLRLCYGYNTCIRSIFHLFTIYSSFWFSLSRFCCCWLCFGFVMKALHMHNNINAFGVFSQSTQIQKNQNTILQKTGENGIQLYFAFFTHIQTQTNARTLTHQMLENQLYSHDICLRVKKLFIS